MTHRQRRRAKVDDIARLQKRLDHTKARLQRLIEEIEARPDDIDCAVNARQILSRLFADPAMVTRKADRHPL